MLARSVVLRSTYSSLCIQSDLQLHLIMILTFDNRNVIAEDDEEDDIEIARQIAEDWAVWEE